MPIPDSFIDDLVSRTDLAELVSGYVRLTKRSGANMFGLCPFHSEKTPSFSVNADKQIYYCFGCGKGGGAINFVMEIENHTFRDAVEFLARRAGMAVPETETADGIAAKRSRMLELNRDAARHFHKILLSPLGQQARDYLAKRRISKASMIKFGLGTAPDSWTLLLDAMAKKGYSKQEVIDAGLARNGRSGGVPYDMFRDRLMFPVIDVRGGVIGFSGRALGDGEPKYINSPDTVVFNKSRNLFALNLAKKTKAGMLILAEGNIDVVALHQAGFDCAVASLGTSLTTEQARLMSRYTDRAVIAYDSDEAGRKASMRAIPLLEKTGMSVKVVDFGNSKDPDEFLKNRGVDAFRVILDRSENHVEYRLAMIEKKFDMATDEGRLLFLAEATQLLSELETKPEREIYGNRVARTAGISPESVESEVARRVKIRRSRQKKEFEKKVTSPTAAIQPEDKTLRYKNEYSAAAEEGVIRCLVSNPKLLGTVLEMGFSHDEFTSHFLAKVFGIICARVSEGRDTQESLITSGLESGEASQLAVIMQKPEAMPQSDVIVREYVEKIRTEKYKTSAPIDDLLIAIKKQKMQGPAIDY